MENPLSRKILFLKVKNQDSEAYSQFYDLYVTRIYRFIFFKINSPADAQDITSEVFLKLWQHIKDEKEIRNLNALVYMIARNAVIDFYRQKSRTEEPLTGEHQSIADERNNNELQRQMINSELEETLKGLENLKDEYKEVIVLKYLDDLSIAEISQVLGKSNGAVRVTLHRALKALKENIKNR